MAIEYEKVNDTTVRIITPQTVEQVTVTKTLDQLNAEKAKYAKSKEDHSTYCDAHIARLDEQITEAKKLGVMTDAEYIVHIKEVEPS